jgi:hypothetical protein
MDMLGELLGKYAWVNDIEAWTIAVIQSHTAADVIGIYGGDPADPVGDYFFAEAASLQGMGYPDVLDFHLQILERDKYVVALENNGWTGSVPEIARRCSADNGRFFSVYWNVNAFGMLTEATDGRITAHFESLYPIAPEPPQPGEVRPPWAIGEAVDVALAWQACLVLMEQQTGLAFEQAWLTGTLPTYRIPDVDALLKGVQGAREV